MKPRVFVANKKKGYPAYWRIQWPSGRVSDGAFTSIADALEYIRLHGRGEASI